MARRARMLAETETDLAGSWPCRYPTSVVWVSAGTWDGARTICPVVAHMVCCRHPFSVAIGLCRTEVAGGYYRRYAYDLAKETGEFVVNQPPVDSDALTALLGSYSGRGEAPDKFARAGLTAERGLCVAAPVIAECPLSLECAVTDEVIVGTHAVLIGRVLAIHGEGRS